MLIFRNSLNFSSFRKYDTMKKITITPILLFVSLSIVLFILYIRSIVSLLIIPLIIIFVAIMLFFLIVDRIVREASSRRPWMVEIIFIVLVTMPFLLKCC